MTDRDLLPWAVVAAGAVGVYLYAARVTGPAPGTSTAPSGTRVTAAPGTASVAVNQYLAQPASPPGFAVPPPAGIALILSRITTAPVVGQPVTVQAFAQNLAAYNATLIDQGRIGATANWTWVLRAPSGAVVQRLQEGAGAKSTYTWFPTSAGTWTVQAVASVRGFVTGPSTITVTVAPA